MRENFKKIIHKKYTGNKKHMFYRKMKTQSILNNTNLVSHSLF